VTQSWLYGYWEKDYMRKNHVRVWKKVVRPNTITGYGNSNDVLIKAKAVLRKIITGVNRYKQLYKLNPIPVTNGYLLLVVF